MKKCWISFLCLFLLLVGCKDKPEKPESTVDAGVNVMKVVSHVPTEKKEQMDMVVHHFIKGNDVYIECIVTPDFHFTSDKEENHFGEGKIKVYSNQKEMGTYTKGAFVLRNLEKGNHPLTIKLLHNDQSEYGLSETINITIK
ncbi:hypothetical protein FIU87_08830 [Bacillus sp. THAF10]|uniref:hypothetical protein n=1 Tax=Bacillus sp. THAF10 TaxID=2587848 RepID=UPI0012A8C16D|nr:hypothetical protein [Bacillus sp. THAF10]QFT88747.1 hypothetical protein FIU87_08830 [Bacillus sp. THAF10]